MLFVNQVDLTNPVYIQTQLIPAQSSVELSASDLQKVVKGGGKKMFKLILLAILAVAVIWFAWPRDERKKYQRSVKRK